eukprot:scaffold5887_cov122-Cylindrotheca_fusiformis.AAC.19
MASSSCSSLRHPSISSAAASTRLLTSCDVAGLKQRTMAPVASILTTFQYKSVNHLGRKKYQSSCCDLPLVSNEFRALSAMMKQLSHKIVENGGIVRSIQNHGIRQFPHRVQARNPDFITGQRYFEKGRYISIYYDSNPATRSQVERLLSMDDQVLRNTHVKARSKLDWITMQRPDKNPYVQKVLRMDEEKQLEESTPKSIDSEDSS